MFIGERRVWKKSPKGGNRPKYIPTLSWSFRGRDEKQFLLDLEEVEAAAAAWKPFSSHVGMDVHGDGFHAPFFNLGIVLQEFETPPAWDSQTRSPVKPIFDEQRVRMLLDRLAAFVESDKLVYITKTIIVGLRIDESLLPLNLADGMVIDALTEDDVQRFGEMELIQRPPGNPADLYNWTGYPWLALHWTRIVPKRVNKGFQHTDKAFDRTNEKFESVHAALFESLALLRYGVAGMGGSLTELAGWDFRSSTIVHPRTDAPKFMASGALDLTAEDVAAWPGLYARVSELPTGDAVSVAMRRLAYAMERRRPEDRLLDAMIAAEAVFGKGEKTELSFRISLRLAMSTKSEDADARRSSFDLMRAAYAVRSSVVHGNVIKANSLKINGSTVSLAAFVNAVEEIIRVGIRYAITEKDFSVDSLDASLFR